MYFIHWPTFSKYWGALEQKVQAGVTPFSRPLTIKSASIPQIVKWGVVGGVAEFSSPQL